MKRRILFILGLLMTVGGGAIAWMMKTNVIPFNHPVAISACIAFLVGLTAICVTPSRAIED